MSASSRPSKLIFHIGHHKTGSTSIQEAFATGRVQVAGAKILYPGQMSHNYLPRHFEAYAKSGETLKGAPGRPGLAEIAARLQAGGFDYAVLSGEEFERMAPDSFAAVLRATLLPQVDEASVICYVRPHAARLLSSYAEQVKLGVFSDGLAAFQTRQIANGRLLYAPQMAAWTAAFGPQFQARPMVRDLMEAGSVVQDFARLAFGPQAQITVRDGGSANESLCLEDLVMLRHIQAHLKAHARPLRHAMGWTLAMALAQSRRSGAGTKLALPRGLAEGARQAYLEDARALDAGIFASTPVMERELDRAVDLAVSEPQSMEPADHFSPEELRHVSILAELLADMLHKDSDGWRSFMLERRVSGVLGADGMPVAPRRKGGKKGAKRAGAGPKAGRKAGLKRAGAQAASVQAGAVQTAEGKPGGRKAGGGKAGKGKKAVGGKRRLKAAEA
ncbi:hypothetical protein SAMN04488103_1169 [Gemmobacter aquatilis]|uniref:Uncharacterized protein n=1 Tax=Gemmobacter aquatilis TaxID=933059 RepID=A0A1H8N231_9RHOB|nr:hypothetical protein [Gemmobacter aquatilis]SEO23553.1 hypothetical protein SAMN04488103_1169 [Gemmobacter aquatilis]